MSRNLLARAAAYIACCAVLVVLCGDAAAQDIRSKDALRSTVRVVLNPDTHHPSTGTGTVVKLDREKYPDILAPDEVLVVTAMHVSDGETLTGGIYVDSTAFTATGTDFGLRFKARLVERGDKKKDGDIAILAVKVPASGEASKVLREADISLDDPDFGAGDVLLLAGCAQGKPAKTATCNPIQVFRAEGQATGLVLNTGRIGGDSGGGAFDAKGRLVAVCSGSSSEATTVWIGPGLRGFDATRGYQEHEIRKYHGVTSHFVPTFHVKALLARACERMEPIPFALSLPRAKTPSALMTKDEVDKTRAALRARLGGDPDAKETLVALEKALDEYEKLLETKRAAAKEREDATRPTPMPR